jgi:hypothetical protein
VPAVIFAVTRALGYAEKAPNRRGERFLEIVLDWQLSQEFGDESRENTSVAVMRGIGTPSTLTKRSSLSRGRRASLRTAAGHLNK